MFEVGKTIVSAISGIIDRIIPDPKIAADAKIKLAELQQNGELKLEEFKVEEKKIDAEDRASARTRETEVSKATGKKDYIPAVLALSLTLGFFGLLTLLIFKDVPETTQQILFIMIGSLATSFTSIITYYFGSSSSSRAKDSIISKVMINDKK